MREYSSVIDRDGERGVEAVTVRRQLEQRPCHW
jgi:hypothetical protein